MVGIRTDVSALTFCLLGNFACFFGGVSADFFFKINFLKISFRNTIRLSNSLDSDHTWQKRPDLLSVLIWVQTVCKIINRQQKTKVALSKKNWQYQGLWTAGLEWVEPHFVRTNLGPNCLQRLSTLCLLVSSADNFYLQFGPSSGATKCLAWSKSKLFDTLIVFLKEFFEKVDFEKITIRQKNMEKFPAGKELTCNMLFCLPHPLLLQDSVNPLPHDSAFDAVEILHMYLKTSWKMEQLLHLSICSIFHNIFKSIQNFT